MSIHHQICLEYEEFLGQSQKQSLECRVLNFKMIIENLNNSDPGKQIKQKFISSHLEFLQNAITNCQLHLTRKFATLLFTLNFLLKTNISYKFPLTQVFIQALVSQLSSNCVYTSSPAVISNILWLVCKGIKCAASKEQALSRVSRSGLVTLCLRQAVLDSDAQRAVSMLLLYISKFGWNKSQIAYCIIANLHKFKQLQSIQQILFTLKQLNLPALGLSINTTTQLAGFFQIYLKLDEVQWNQKMKIWEMIVWTAVQVPSFIHKLKVNQLIQWKLSLNQSEQTQISEICELIDYFKHDSVIINQYLQLSLKNIIFNPIARRVFITYHEMLNDSQMMIILMSDLPVIINRLLINRQDLQNGLKMVICLTRSVKKLGLSMIMNYSFWQVHQTINALNRKDISSSALELLQLFDFLYEGSSFFANNYYLSLTD